VKEGEQKTTGSGTKPPSASIASGLQGCCLSKAFKDVVCLRPSSMLCTFLRLGVHHSAESCDLAKLLFARSHARHLFFPICSHS